MTAQYVSMPVQWRCLTIQIGNWPEHALSWRIQRRLDLILTSWEETPYQPGQQQKRVGVDCIRFGCAVLDELYRVPPTTLPIRAADASMHDREGAFSVMRQIMERYPRHEEVTDGWVEPGDVLVTGPRNGGPGHMMIVGPRANTVWQASSDHVHYTGLALPYTSKLFRVYRMCDRELWA